MTVIGIRICLSFSSCCVHGCAQSTRFASVRSVSCFSFSLVFFFFHSLCFFCYYIFLYFYRQPASQSIRREKKKISLYALTSSSFLRQRGRRGKKDEKSNKQNALLLLLQLTIYLLVFKLTCMCNCLSKSAFVRKQIFFISFYS